MVWEVVMDVVLIPQDISQLLIWCQWNMSSEFISTVIVMGYCFSFQLPLLPRALTTFEGESKALNLELWP